MSRKTALEEMRGKDSRELRYDLEMARKELFQSRFQMTTESSKPSDIRTVKRLIARILTILQEREDATRDSSSTSSREVNKVLEAKEK